MQAITGRSSRLGARSKIASSLVEVSVAALLLAGAVLPCVSMVHSGMRSASWAQDEEHARYLLVFCLEKLHAHPFEEFCGLPRPDAPAGWQRFSVPAEAPGRSFSVSFAFDPAPAGMRRAGLLHGEVQWYGLDGRSRGRRLAVPVFRNGGLL